MKVYLKNTWFSPSGNRYRKQRSYTMPDAWESMLPATAEILEDSEPGEAVEVELQEKPVRTPRKKKEAKVSL